MEIGDGGASVLQQCGKGGDLARKFDGQATAKDKMAEREVEFEAVERRVWEKQGRVQYLHPFQMKGRLPATREVGDESGFVAVASCWPVRNGGRGQGAYGIAGQAP